MAVSEERVTRGRLLKRAGVGAAALGAASMVTASTAAAAAPASTSCIGWENGCGVCDNLVGGCEGDDCCACFVTTEGCCFCSTFVFCAGLKPCTVSSKQCPAGWSCAYTCCSETPVCIPHCGYHGAHADCGNGEVPGARKQAANTGGL